MSGYFTKLTLLLIHCAFVGLNDKAVSGFSQTQHIFYLDDMFQSIDYHQSIFATDYKIFQSITFLIFYYICKSYGIPCYMNVVCTTSIFF